MAFSELKMHLLKTNLLKTKKDYNGVVISNLNKKFYIFLKTEIKLE